MPTGNQVPEHIREDVSFHDAPVSAFENALKQFDAAAGVLNLTKNQIAVIKEPRRVTVSYLEWMEPLIHSRMVHGIRAAALFEELNHVRCRLNGDRVLRLGC